MLQPASKAPFHAKIGIQPVKPFGSKTAAEFSLWLTGHGYFSAVRPGPPAAQNEIMVGLMLLVLAIIPNEASEPPVPWRDRQSSPDTR